MRKKIGISILIALLTLGLTFIVFMYFVITGAPASKTSDVRKYGEFEKYNCYSNLYIFPVEIPDSAVDLNYYYYFRDELFDPSCQIYLEYSLSEEDYNSEGKRLSKITIEFEHDSYKHLNHEIIYDNEHFNYPAYVTVFNNDQTFEYALLNEEEHKIIYVFKQFTANTKVKFDEEYLPQNINGDEYNLYLSGKKYGIMNEIYREKRSD